MEVRSKIRGGGVGLRAKIGLEEQRLGLRSSFLSRSDWKRGPTAMPWATHSGVGWGGWKVDTSENETASGGGKNERFYTYYREGLGRRESALRRAG